MALEFRFPDVGEGIHEGEIVRWLVQEGDSVRPDQPLVEVETTVGDVAVVGTAGRQVIGPVEVHVRVDDPVAVVPGDAARRAS